MRTLPRRTLLLGAAAVLFALAAALYLRPSPAAAQAETPKAPAIDPDADLRQNLEAFKSAGDKIQVSLRAGRVITGTVTAVGKHFFLMEEMDEAQDRAALVRQDDVSAINFPARQGT